MKKIFLAAFIVVASLGLIAYASYARGPMDKSGFMTFNAMDLIGASVRNPQGRYLGIVSGVLIDSQGHAFALVNHGDYDLYGSGGVNTPVPIAALKISEAKSGKEKIVLNTDTEHMDFAPYDNPAKSYNRQQAAGIYEYFGLQPHWTEQGARAK